MFNGCVRLTNIVIPDTVQKMSAGVFYGCDKLKTIRMPYALLQTNLFFPSSKMVTLELTKDGNVVETIPAVFRKDYSSKPNWLHKEDYLIPIGKKDILLFDKLIAAGTYAVLPRMRIRELLQYYGGLIPRIFPSRRNSFR